MTDQGTHLNRFDEPDAIDELMDRVADQLQAQVRSANQKLRSRAARMLSPRTNRGGRIATVYADADVDVEADVEVDVDADTADAGIAHADVERPSPSA